MEPARRTRTCISSYRKHQYSGKSTKRVRAALKRCLGAGEGDSGEKVWRKKKETKKDEQSCGEIGQENARILRKYSRKAPKQTSVKELSKEEERINFETELNNLYQEGSNNRWSNERILEVMNIIEEYNAAPDLKKSRTSTHYYYWTHYEIIEEDGEEILIQKRKEPTDPLVKILPTEKYFDYLSKIHEETNHGGRDKLKFALGNKYNIPTSAVQLFLSLCAVCKAKKLQKQKNTSEEIERTPEALNHGQINLIDKQNQPDGDKKWILHYQDVVTKFSILRPLASNSAKDIAQELFKIFADIGPPEDLRYLDLDVCESVVNEVNKMWSGLDIVRSSELGYDHQNCYIESLLYSWMMERNTLNWVLGLNFVHYKMNNTFDTVLGKTPFKALFGYDQSNVDIHENSDKVFFDVKLEEEPEPFQKVLIVDC